MTQRAAFYTVGGIFGMAILVSLAIPEVTGLGPENRALPGRLATAKSLGLDPGYRNLIARDAAKPAAARRAFDELDAILRDQKRFALPKPRTSPLPKGAKPPTSARTLEDFRPDLRRIGALSRAAENGSLMDWSKGWELTFPQYANIKATTNAADGLVRADAAKGRYADATQNVLDAADVWHAYGDDPVAIADLVRTACTSLLFRTSGRLLADPGYPATEARRLSAMFEGSNFAPRVSIPTLFVMEATGIYEILDHPEKIQAAMGYSVGSSDRNIERGMRITQVRRAWQSDALRLFNETYPKLPKDPYDFNGAKRVLEAYDRQIATPRGIKGQFMEQIGSVLFSGLTDAQRKREATRRVMLVAAALRSGEKEAALRRRLGPLAVDPYDGKPLRVRPATETPYWLKEAPALPIATRALAVYSVGPNGKDDGGKTTQKQDEGDLVLVVPR